LPPYDEYLIAYKDRSAALDAALWNPIATRDPFVAPIVLDGRVVGGWKRTVGKDAVSITLDLLERLSRVDARLVDDAAQRYAAFLGLMVSLGSGAGAPRPRRKFPMS
jgi:Winged helix DNA-binding domain